MARRNDDKSTCRFMTVTGSQAQRPSNCVAASDHCLRKFYCYGLQTEFKAVTWSMVHGLVGEMFGGTHDFGKGCKEMEGLDALVASLSLSSCPGQGRPSTRKNSARRRKYTDGRNGNLELRNSEISQCHSIASFRAPVTYREYRQRDLKAAKDSTRKPNSRKSCR